MKYYFGDNREYGADDIKKALGVLVAGSGVSIELTDGVEYEPSALNAIVASAVASGVVPEGVESLRLNHENGRYTVSPGKAVFSDGGIAVCEGETEITAAPGQYVYLAYSAIQDEVYFHTSPTTQKEGDGMLLVPIAYIKPDGKIENRRVYARGKIPALASADWNTLRPVEFTADVSPAFRTGGYAECVHEFEGEMNFMLVNGSSYIGIMYLDSGVSYSSVYAMSSREYGSSNGFICVKGTGIGLITATLLEKGNGYIKMRYKIPGGYTKTEITYSALIGIKN